MSDAQKVDRSLGTRPPGGEAQYIQIFTQTLRVLLIPLLITAEPIVVLLFLKLFFSHPSVECGGGYRLSSCYLRVFDTCYRCSVRRRRVLWRDILCGTSPERESECKGCYPSSSDSSTSLTKNPFGARETITSSRGPVRGTGSGRGQSVLPQDACDHILLRTLKVPARFVAGS